MQKIPGSGVSPPLRPIPRTVLTTIAVYYSFDAVVTQEIRNIYTHTNDPFPLAYVVGHCLIIHEFEG